VRVDRFQERIENRESAVCELLANKPVVHVHGAQNRRAGTTQRKNLGNDCIPILDKSRNRLSEALEIVAAPAAICIKQASCMEQVVPADVPRDYLCRRHRGAQG